MAKHSTKEIELKRNLVGVQLKKWRISANLSQKDVAMKLGYSSSQFVSNWERGHSLPPVEALAKLIKIFDIKPKQVIDLMYHYQEKHLEFQKKFLRKQLANL
jgi:transcriptional regulator with XRE-family HTH domain